MCKQQARSSQCANATGAQSFLGHDKGFRKVIPQKCSCSGFRGQKNCFTCCIQHNFDHNESMQVLQVCKPLFLAWYCFIWLAVSMSNACITHLCYFDISLGVLLFGYIDMMSVLKWKGDGHWLCPSVSYEWSRWSLLPSGPSEFSSTAIHGLFSQIS